MDIFMIGFWVVGLALFLLSWFRKKKETKSSMSLSKNMMKNMLPDILGVIMIIGFVLALVPPEMIQGLLGDSSKWWGTVAGAIIGSVTLIPAFVAFPLIGSLIDIGASILPAVAFLTTLTMVGVMTFPIEKKEFGLKFTLLRNGLSFVCAIVIAVLMGVVLG